MLLSTASESSLLCSSLCFCIVKSCFVVMGNLISSYVCTIKCLNFITLHQIFLHQDLHFIKCITSIIVTNHHIFNKIVTIYNSSKISQALPKFQFLCAKCVLYKLFSYYAGIMFNTLKFSILLCSKLC